MKFTPNEIETLIIVLKNDIDNLNRIIVNNDLKKIGKEVLIRRIKEREKLLSKVTRNID